jgi:hypothetical protein
MLGAVILLAGLVPLSVTAGVSAPTPTGSIRSTSTPAATTPPATASGTAASTPQERLRALADRLTASPTDDHVGRFDYVRTQLWARATTKVARFETEKWRAADGSGRVVERRPADRADLTRLPDGNDRGDFATAQAEVQDYGPGRLAPEVSLPIATGPDALAAQMYTISPPENGPLSLITAVSNINRTHYLDRANRADVLRVLATIPTITYQGQTVDIAGRAGQTWAVDTGSGTELLTFDPATGELRTHQSLLNTQPPSLFAYVLFVQRDRVTQPGG